MCDGYSGANHGPPADVNVGDNDTSRPNSGAVGNACGSKGPLVGSLELSRWCDGSGQTVIGEDDMWSNEDATSTIKPAYSEALFLTLTFVADHYVRVDKRVTPQHAVRPIRAPARICTLAQILVSSPTVAPLSTTAEGWIQLIELQFGFDIEARTLASSIWID